MKKLISRLLIIPILFTGFTVFAQTNNTNAQVNNIFLDGDNYITLANPAFPERLDWNAFSVTEPIAAQQPITTYWFTHNGKAHIVIHLKNDKSEFFMELSGNKKTYQFPANMNYSPSDDAGKYRFNDLWLYVAEKSGTVRKFVLAKNTHLSIQVQQLDPAHLKIDFSGTIDYYPHPSAWWDDGPISASMQITGKISLSKKNPMPEHLSDNYTGCDNNIYNEVSPNWRLGQWRSVTDCEESFYKKVYAALAEAMKPLNAYFKSQGWKVYSQTAYKPLDVRLKKANTNFFVTCQFPVNYDYTLEASDPLNETGAYHDYNQRYTQFMINASKPNSGQSEEAKGAQRMQLYNEGKEFSLNLKIYLNRPLQTDSYPDDVSNIPIGKLSGATYLIQKVLSKDWHQTEYYDTYLLIGNWQQPQWNNHNIEATPGLAPNAKELSIQSLYIDLDCGQKLAGNVISHINLAPLQQLLKTQP